MIDLAGSILAAHTRQNAEGCIKVEEDLERYRLLINVHQPTVIVETGTAYGTSAAWFARNSYARIVSVDIDGTNRVAPELVDNPQIMWLRGSSIHPTVIANVGALIGADDQVLVILDSAHSADHVRAELDAYAPFVTAGSFLVVEDTICRWLEGDIVAANVGGPLDAVDEWLPTHPEFAADEDIENLFPVTQHPGGWLRRLA